MIRLAVSVEGETEEEFVKQVLAEHLRTRNVEPQPFLLNGNVTVDRLASDMAKLFWSFDFVTSLVDFYGFRDKTTETREELEQRIFEAVEHKIRRSWNQTRAFPYIQQHEFEALLFSDVNAFACLGHVSEGCVTKLVRIRSQFSTPEDINDNKDTAPSKRISRLMPRYRKVVDGPLVAAEAGLEAIRAECPRFDKWVTRLESLGEPVTS